MKMGLQATGIRLESEKKVQFLENIPRSRVCGILGVTAGYTEIYRKYTR